jgi:putative flippase GtrA
MKELHHEVMHGATAPRELPAGAASHTAGTRRHSLRVVSDAAASHLVEVVIPVYNEERVLATNIRQLHAYLTVDFPYSFVITIADNASTDATFAIAQQLAAELPEVQAVHLDLKGRGRALRFAWGNSSADVVAYMDVDLSTSLDAFLPLVAPLLTGHSDLAIGSRLSRGSAVVRGRKREFISRGYNLLLHTALAARFSDAQCGFKAGRTEVVRALLPAVEDNAWFFDTELLLLAERNGLRIHEVPVDWVDDPDSRVDIGQTIRDDLRGMLRVARKSLSDSIGAQVAPRVQQAALPSGMRRQLPRFAVVGVLSTLAQILLYILARTVMPTLAANALSLFATTIVNTAANRRFTFGLAGSGHALRQQLDGGITFGISLMLSSTGLVVLLLVAPHASRGAELITVVSCNLAVTLIRYLVMRAWVFNPRRQRQVHVQQNPAPEQPR